MLILRTGFKYAATLDEEDARTLMLLLDAAIETGAVSQQPRLFARVQRLQRQFRDVIPLLKLEG